MRILHAADLHLDSPFSSLPAPQAAQRRRELRDIPHRLAQLAQAEGVDLVLLSGDLLDAVRVYPQSVQALAQALGELSVPVFLAPGNHDPYTPQSPYVTAQWPPNVHIFSTASMEAVEVAELNAVIHGCAFTSTHREDAPLSGYTVPKDGRVHLLCLHGEVAPMGRYAPILPGQLGATGAHYAALGHVHRGSGLQREGNTYWAYPGCPEGRGFDETGKKGCLVVDVTTQGTSAKFVPLCCREYRIQEVPVDNLAQTLAGLDYCSDLVRLTLTGETDTPPSLTALTQQVAPHFFYAEWVDATTLPRQLWQRAGEDTLTGLFLRSMYEKIQAAPPDQQPQLILATRFGLAALEGEEDICP